MAGPWSADPTREQFAHAPETRDPGAHTLLVFRSGSQDDFYRPADLVPKRRAFTWDYDAITDIASLVRKYPAYGSSAPDWLAAVGLEDLNGACRRLLDGDGQNALCCAGDEPGGRWALSRDEDDGRLRLCERHATQARLATQLPNAGRNDPCPCASHRKFKRCCGA